MRPVLVSYICDNGPVRLKKRLYTSYDKFCHNNIILHIYFKHEQSTGNVPSGCVPLSILAELVPDQMVLGPLSSAGMNLNI